MRIPITMTPQEELREQFYQQTTMEWLNSDGEPDIDYVEWLENMIFKEKQDNSDSFKY